MKINLHIERLVLDGLPLASGDKHSLQTAVEAQLAMMLTNSSAPTVFGADRSIASLNAPSLRLDSPVSNKAMGNQIGEAIYRSLVQGG